jgi:hypothetical protein
LFNKILVRQYVKKQGTADIHTGRTPYGSDVEPADILKDLEVIFDFWGELRHQEELDAVSLFYFHPRIQIQQAYYCHDSDQKVIHPMPLDDALS